MTRLLEPNPVPEAEEAAAYDALASRFGWLMNRRLFAVLSRIPLKQGRVLDIGSGPGWVPIALALLRPGWKIIALDASEAMLRLACRNAAHEGVEDCIQFVHGDATDLPFASGEFDLVYSHFLLHHMDRPEDVFDEAARVTRPGGQIVLQDFLRPPRWKGMLLTALCRYVLRQTEPQVEMYRNSLAAAMSLREVQTALKKSKLAQAATCSVHGAEVVISARMKMDRLILEK